MTEDERISIALFRYSVITPLVSNTFEGESLNEFYRETSTRYHKNSAGKSIKVSAGTIQRWYYFYQKGGFNELKPQKRNDKGKSRKIDQDIISQIHYLKGTYPRIPATIIYDTLLQNGTCTKKDISLSTVTRYIKKLNMENNFTTNKDMKRYERMHINEVWCGDSSVGPYLKIDGMKYRTYIIALIDDASRMIVGIDIFLHDNFINLMLVMRSAIHKHGKPKRLNFDNGSPYKNSQMTLLSARIGTTLNYCQPYTPTSKAKIERWFRTLKDQWMALLNMNDFNNLEELRTSLHRYVQTYNTRVHQSLSGKTPQQRFFEESNIIKRMSDEQIETSFLLEIERKVSADSVIVIDKTEYEIDYRYAKQRVRLRYSPDLSKIYLVDEERKKLKEIRLLNKHDNASIKREKVKLAGGETE